jgi:hypothetical protein
MQQTLNALRELEHRVLGAKDVDGIILRYGAF